MSPVAYTVTATFSDPAVADEYVEWLRGGHLDAVIAHGADSAMIVRLEETADWLGARIETRYIFATRDRFDRYVREFAPGLRAEGLARFPQSRGVSFERRVGTIL